MSKDKHRARPDAAENAASSGGASSSSSSNDPRREAQHDAGAQDANARDAQGRPFKKVVFDDFQITRQEQAARVEEERRVWNARLKREEEQKGSIFGISVPRLRNLADEMLGNDRKLSFLRRSSKDPSTAPSEQSEQAHSYQEPEHPAAQESAEPYFAEHERSGIRITRRDEAQEESRAHGYQHDGSHHAAYAGAEEYAEGEYADDELLDSELENEEQDDRYDEHHHGYGASAEEHDDEEAEEEDHRMTGPHVNAATEEDVMDGIEALDEIVEYEDDSLYEAPGDTHAAAAQHEAFDAHDVIAEEPQVEAYYSGYLDALRSFDSVPRRGTDARDPRADFVTLLGELLDILREQVAATSAMFFWVNSKRQQLVLESAALDDRAYQYLTRDKRFPIELDAVSRIVSRRTPELISSLTAQAERDLIPYYREELGIRSFAGMPVLFGDGLVGVLTVDSEIDDNFSQETLRILTSHSKLLSGLIRSYIEKYDLLAASRTLQAARKLHQIVSPEPTPRSFRDPARNPDYVIRALAEAAGEILDWGWIATASFDEARRAWVVSSMQARHGGASVPPMTPISMGESLVGRCIQTGQSLRVDALTTQSIRFNIDEDRHGAAGHSFVVIPIRTAAKNYGALAIEIDAKAQYTESDVETLEHLARSTAFALEIMALGQMVGERAMTDLLTGSFNKRGLLMRTGEELMRAMQFDEPLTFVLFEIDNAQELLSRFTPEDSDTIVLAIDRLLRFGARPFDVIARSGDHSFSALLIRMTDEEAFLWCEKMRKMIVSEVIAIGKRSFSVTVSIGVSGARRDGTVEELIEGAELALERAKEVGGNSVIVY